MPPTAGQLTFNGGTLLATASLTLDANRAIALSTVGTLNTNAGVTLTYGGVVAGTGTLHQGRRGHGRPVRRQHLQRRDDPLRGNAMDRRRLRPGHAAGFAHRRPAHVQRWHFACHRQLDARRQPRRRPQRRGHDQRRSVDDRQLRRHCRRREHAHQVGHRHARALEREHLCGSTTVSVGVLRVQNASALGGVATGTSVSSGASLEIDGSGLTLAEPISSLIGGGVSSGGALRSLANSNAWSAAITLGAGGARINSDAGTLTLSGGVTGNTRPLTVGGSGNTVVNGVIATTTGTLTKDGAGTLTLKAPPTRIADARPINAGSVSINSQIQPLALRPQLQPPTT